MSIKGIGDNGEIFDVPEVQSELEGMKWKNATIFEAFAWVLCILSVILTLFYDIPVIFYVIFYLTFRCAYDFGLGFLLNRQSKYRSFENVCHLYSLSY